jgi:hypothetical protein
VGQGQGWQRNIVMNGSPTCRPTSASAWDPIDEITEIAHHLTRTAGCRQVERFTRTDADMTRSSTSSLRSDDVDESMDRCNAQERGDEVNYAMSGILAGARAAGAPGRGEAARIVLGVSQGSGTFGVFPWPSISAQHKGPLHS